MKEIIKVINDDGKIGLMVSCWHCGRTPIIFDNFFCTFCWNEIDEKAHKAWEEYEKENPKTDIYL